MHEQRVKDPLEPRNLGQNKSRDKENNRELEHVKRGNTGKTVGNSQETEQRPVNNDCRSFSTEQHDFSWYNVSNHVCDNLQVQTERGA